MSPPSLNRNPPWINSLDTFAFSQSKSSHFAAPKSIHSGRIQGAGQPSIKVFSQFFYSPTSKDLVPMKFRISKVPPTSKSNIPRIKNISSTMYNDPAFSADPLSHPLFVADHDPAWGPPLALNQPNSDQDRHVPPSSSFSQLQTLATSMPSNGTSTNSTYYNRQSSSTVSFSDSQTSPSAPQSSAPSSVDFHPSTIADNALKTADDSIQKKSPVNLFWRRPDPLSTASTGSGHGRHDSPPSYETTLSTQPQASRNLSTPEIHRSAKPKMPPRPATTAADSKPPPAISPRTIAGHSIRAHELDRIDELDETNPLGVAMHHGGPYEAIQRLAQQNKARIPHNVGSEYQKIFSSNRTQDRQHRTKTSDISNNQQPPGVSLNLVPGQILPHNFQEHYHSHLYEGASLSVATSPYGLSQTQAHPRTQRPWDQLQQVSPTPADLTSDTQQWSNRHMSLPIHPTPPHSETSLLRRKRRSDPSDRSQTSTSPHGPSFNGRTGFGPAIAGAPQPQSSAIPVLRHNDGSIPRGHQDDRRSRLLPDSITFEKQRSSPTEPATAAVEHNTRHDIPNIVQRGDVRANVPNTPQPASPSSNVRNRQTSEDLHPAAGNGATDTQRQDNDVISTRKTISTNNGSFGSQITGRGPQRYLPKRLVMPAPLQPSNVLAATIEPYSSVPPRPRSPSSSKFNQPFHAQDIPMSQSRKLRKRSSVNVLPPVAPPQTKTISFTSKGDYIDPSSVASLPMTAKPPKKVLSKRRTDL